jgi:hypothetical protein
MLRNFEHLPKLLKATFLFAKSYIQLLGYLYYEVW